MPQVKEFYHDIDLKANQLFNSRLHNITTASRTTLGASLSTGDKGYIVYDTDLLKSFFWNGTQWQSVGSVSSVTASSPLASSEGTTPNISIQQASTSQAGYLSSSDWTTFNNKQNLLSGIGVVKSTSGTISYIAGTSAEYIRGDGSLATFPTSIGGGGSSTSYYLNGGTAAGVATYYQMSKTPVVGTPTNFTLAADGLIAQFLTSASDPGLLSIPGGNWTFQLYFSSSSAGGTPSFYVELHKYNGSTFSLIATSSGSPEGITNGTAIDIYTTTLAVPTTTLSSTDRLAVRVYVTHSGRTITLYTQGSNLSQIITTFTTGLISLNGLTAQTQTFQFGTSGTDLEISSSSNVHTFNIPTASANSRGVLSSTDWTSFNSKLSDAPSDGSTYARRNGSWTTITGSGAAGTTGNVQFNRSGTFASSDRLYWDDTNSVLGIGTNTPLVNLSLDVNGKGRFQNTLITKGIISAFSVKTINYTIKDADEVIAADATTDNIEINLPSASSTGAGRRCTIKKIDASNNKVLITTTSSQTIEGRESYTLNARYDFIEVVSDGYNWKIVSKKNTNVTYTISTGYTITDEDDILLCDASNNNVVFQLPTAVGRVGKIYTIKVLATQPNGEIVGGPTVASINCANGQTIDGNSSVTLSVANDYIMIVSNGTNWYIISEKFSPIP